MGTSAASSAGLVDIQLCKRERLFDKKKRNISIVRRSTAVRLRNERQRLLIKSRGVANSEVRRCKATRDRAFAELVYRRIYTRTGGNARAWAVIVASIIRLQFMVGTLSNIGFLVLYQYRLVSVLFMH